MPVEQNPAQAETGLEQNYQRDHSYGEACSPVEVPEPDAGRRIGVKDLEGADEGANDHGSDGEGENQKPVHGDAAHDLQIKTEADAQKACRCDELTITPDPVPPGADGLGRLGDGMAGRSRVMMRS